MANRPEEIIFPVRVEVLSLLYCLGGTFVDPSGRATRALGEMLPSRDRKNLMSALLNAMEKDGQIIRDVRNKRCFEITLNNVSERMAARMKETIRSWHVLAVPAVVEPVPVESVQVVETPQVVEALAEIPLSGTSAVDVADAILSRIASLLALESQVLLAPVETSAEVSTLQERLDDALTRLNNALHDAQRYRIKHREVQDELIAVKGQYERLRNEARMMKHNIEAMSKDNGAIIRVEVLKQLDKVMRQAPGDPRSMTTS